MRFQNSPRFKLFSQHRRNRQWLLIVLSIAAIAFVMRLALGLLTAEPSQVSSAAFQPLTTISGQAQQVKAGIFVTNLYNLDAASNTYYLDFYVWLKWRGEIDPIANLEFINGVEDWGMTQVAGYEKPRKLADGSSYQVLRVESRFVEPFVLDRYPLDQQTLKITLENSVYTLEKLAYVADTADSGFADDLAVPGWKIKNYRLVSLAHQYTSRFGLPTAEEKSSTYSALQYELQISRPLSFFVWKLLLPLLIVLLTSWGALLLHPSYVDSRIILPVTALLTTVFLQQAYSSALPDVGYLVLLDKIYALAYLLIITAILEAIVTADWVSSDKPDAMARVVQIDRLFLVGQCFVLVVGVTLLIAL